MRLLIDTKHKTVEVLSNYDGTLADVEALIKAVDPVNASMWRISCNDLPSSNTSYTGIPVFNTICKSDLEANN
jgi:hypothetical protein